MPSREWENARKLGAAMQEGLRTGLTRGIPAGGVRFPSMRMSEEAVADLPDNRAGLMALLESRFTPPPTAPIPSRYRKITRWHLIREDGSLDLVAARLALEEWETAVIVRKRTHEGEALPWLLFYIDADDAVRVEPFRTWERAIANAEMIPSAVAHVREGRASRVRRGLPA